MIALAHQRGSVTSFEAARAKASTAEAQREAVLSWYRGRDALGGTREEAALALGLPIQSICPRVRELVKSGNLCATGETRTTQNGIRAEVLFAGGGHREAKEKPHTKGTKMNNAIVQASAQNALAIRGVDDLQTIADTFEKSGMFGCTQKGQGMVLAMTCVMTGMSPLEVNQTYHIIDGRLSMRADAMLAKFMERGGGVKLIERTPERAAAVFKKDQNSTEFSYSMEEAKASGICYGRDGKTLKTNWAKFPKQMLWARLVSDAVRTLDPGVNMGTYAPEEIADFSNSDIPVVQTVVATDAAREPERKQEPVASEPAKAAESASATDDAVDPNVMPVGKFAGKAWAELETKVLEQVIAAKHEKLTDAHKSAAAEEIRKRDASQAAEPKATEPEAVKAELVDTDPGKMPVGKLAGTPWKEMTDDQLKKVLAAEHPAILDAHKMAVEAELKSRGKKKLPFGGDPNDLYVPKKEAKHV